MSKVQEKPFSQQVKRTHYFNTHRKVLEEDIPIPERPAVKKRAPLIEHDKAFKPSHPPRTGYNKTLAKFPDYQPDPKKPIERKMPVEGEDDKKAFKPSYNGKSRPTPSVACNMRNIKTAFPSVFRR